MVESYQSHYPKVAPTAFVHRAAVVIGEVSIGPESSVWPGATLRGDDGPIRIGAQSSIQDGAVLHNTQGLSVTVVGDRVTVGHGAILHGCTVEPDCVIGIGAIVLDNAYIETGCFIGAGALIPPGKRIATGSVVFGNPMRVIRQCSDKDRHFIEYAVQEYVRRTREYLARDAAEDTGP